MKKVKKIFAMFLAMAMVLGMSMTALAAQADPLDTALKDDTKVATAHGYPSKDDKATVKISGLEGNPTVTLYQIAEPEYVDRGLKGFKFVEGAEALENNQQPTAEQITEIANGIKAGTVSAAEVKPEELSYTGDTYTGKLGAGAYIAIIAGGSDARTYNPIYLTVTYNSEGQVVGGTVGVGESYLWGATAVAKHTAPGVKKDIDDTTTTTDSTIKVDGTTADVKGGETASLGDTIGYTVKPNPMPSYPKNAANQTLFIADTMNTGLTFHYDSLEVKLQYPDGSFLQDSEKKDIVLKPGADGRLLLQADSFVGQGEERVIGTAAPTKAGKAQTDAEGADGFNINFNYKMLIYDEAGNTFTPVVTYNATLNESAVAGKPGLENKVKIYFASSSVSGSTYDGLDEPTEGEDIKKQEDEEIVYTYRLAIRKTDDADTPNPLGGAIFGVYADEECTELVCTMTSDSNGYAISNQIGTGKEENGIYWVKELQAPNGYQLNPEAFEVEVTWEKATSKVAVTTTTVSWTTNVNEAENPSDPEQIGWAKSGELKAMDTYADAEAAKADSAQAAYKRFVSASTSTVTGTIENDQGAGSGVVMYGKDVINKKLIALPSTGGIGTTIFTIGGCAIMIVAAGLFFATRRKAEK